MYLLAYTGAFKKDVKRIKRRGLATKLLAKLLFYLEEDGNVPLQNKPHKLSGEYSDCWECHIKPDWLLIWRKFDTEKIIELVRTGSHSDLFK